MHVMEARGVRKTYEADGAPVRALRGIDVTMDDTEFVAVMGPSGCGKSTLLNLVAGLDTPTEGEIVVAGESLADKDENALARMRRAHIGIVFQFFNLLEGMSVLENVTLPAVIAGARRRQAESRARDLLDMLGLADKQAAAPGVLSGGQRQRLAIARALANKPTLLLADEPTGALDSDGGLEVLELFRRLHTGGQAILLVTHDDDVAAAATRIVRMRDGRIEDDGTAVGARRRRRGRDARRRPRDDRPGRRPRDDGPGRTRHRHAVGGPGAGRGRAASRRAGPPRRSPPRCWPLVALAAAVYAPVLGRHGNLATEVVRSVLIGRLRAGGRLRRGAAALRAPGAAGSGRHRARGHRRPQRRGRRGPHARRRR